MRAFFVSCCLLMLLGCEYANEQNKSEQLTARTDDLANPIADQLTAEAANESNITHQTVEWADLIPADDLEILLNPPTYLNEIEDGSPEDQIVSNIQNTKDSFESKYSIYQQALTSTRIIGAMDGKHIRVPGFVVPLEFDENQDITSFFLVPFFGACIHGPPPPPNQIIYVKAKQGFLLESLYDPVWISGTLSTTTVENQVATSAYSMTMQAFASYDEVE